MLQRRAILAVLTSGLAAAIVPTNVVASVLTAGNRRSSSTSLRTRLHELLGHDFRLEDSTGATTYARLVGLDDGPLCRGLEQFSVVFEGAELSEGINELYHPVTGSFPISLLSSDCSGVNRTRKRAYFSMFGRNAAKWAV